ncbi:hypothetical protein T4A_12270 [Trichinella pseudospiralis]|uniref:Uncharacterized protein n=1 Tax=Trichinella pseudospiralis TaxID=6337 RepID=A0A0V1E210_TRIPS|nr:hypothetical protein T4A_12270 [Trichinella pseudospiralis]KRY81339.1 hypothetical protein T4D_9458 [Trichinella pseudospiralis]
MSIFTAVQTDRVVIRYELLFVDCVSKCLEMNYLVKNRSSFRSIGWLADVHRDAEVHFEKGRINKNIGTTNRISFWSLHWLAVDWQSIGWMLL